MLNKIWMHKLYANELGLDGRGSFVLVPKQAYDLFPEIGITTQNCNVKIIIVNLNDLEIETLYSRPPSKQENRLSIPKSHVGDIGSAAVFRPNSLCIFYKNDSNIFLKVLDESDGEYADYHKLFSERDNNAFGFIKFENQSSSKDRNVRQAQFIGQTDFIRVSKPFILLPGISGTGKSRLVRNQVEQGHRLIVPVRPDWHEPSDLLGYVSRISGRPEYVATDALRFIAKAWKDACLSASPDGVILKQHSEMQAFWLCLDEMNLAPVEQYFADYLSVLESRKWNGTPEGYSCEPILRIRDDVENIRPALGLDDQEYDGLWSYFKEKGIPLPPNLIVAGTVNMDETTHGFSRKVIDRALTFDYGEFFPNDFDDYFAQSMSPVKLSFPTRTHIDDKSQLSVAAFDNDGEKSIAFLSQVNDVLKGTSFELAYRALNELLLSVYFHAPGDDSALKAVWDDFIMMKVLPRIEGDNEKLASRTDDNSNVIQQLEQLLLPMFPEGGKRTDFYRVGKDGAHPSIEFRSVRKLRWMQKRLNNNGFTSFWP